MGDYSTYIHACIATYMHMDVCFQLCAEPSSASYFIHNHACMHVYIEMSETRLRYIPV